MVVFNIFLVVAMVVLLVSTINAKISLYRCFVDLVSSYNNSLVLLAELKNSKADESTLNFVLNTLEETFLDLTSVRKFFNFKEDREDIQLVSPSKPNVIKISDFLNDFSIYRRYLKEQLDEKTDLLSEIRECVNNIAVTPEQKEEIITALLLKESEGGENEEE